MSRRDVEKAIGCDNLEFWAREKPSGAASDGTLFKP